MYDITVIGAGVVGAMLAKKFSNFNLNVLVLERDDDVGTGATRANSGIAHAGYDPVPNTLQAKLNVQGHRMFPELTKELDVPYKAVGSLVVAKESGYSDLKKLYERGLTNGAKVEFIERERILQIEPNVADDVKYALWAPEAGIVSPYKLCIAAFDYAVLNGVQVKLNSEVVAIKKVTGGYEVETKNGAKHTTKVLINAAANMDINKMLGEEIHPVETRRGEYFLLDTTASDSINTVLFPLPDENGKGILVAPTADGNVIYGPTSIPSSLGDTEVLQDGLDKIRLGISKSYKAANYRKVIRLFAGQRCVVGKDFIIKESEQNKGYIMLLGICSPGLTSAPAIAEYVFDIVKNNLTPVKKSKMTPLPKHTRIRDLTDSELNALIKQQPLYGRVICRCETISEQEIINAIHSPIPATTVDAVKRRARAGMGRCQGGFCMPPIIKILSRELNLPMQAIKKGGEGSEIILEKIVAVEN
jgi:glycerol-3-phosphate dehydrogenase